ncbi:vacuolar protein sorting-associated family 26 protein [Dongshaea marina]|uniref:hypothetical protein n=1 Tax=Dongshaea marina TaxID=2047966 RepID=UPI000D3E7154|nr:hypothetical protein [Dongshaea marina]
MPFDNLMILFAFILVVGGTLGLILLRRSKGELTIECEPGPFSPQQPVSGRLRVKAKRQIRGNRLKINLHCIKRARRSQGDRVREFKETLYRQELLLDEGGNYEPADERSYDFMFRLSEENLQPVRGSRHSLKAWAELIQPGEDARLSWELVARLDASGADLVTRKDIEIQLP